MLSIIVAGRNDDYGKDFKERLFRTALHNCSLLRAAGVEFEYILAEWNPLSDRPPLSQEFVARIPNSRSVIVPPAIHDKYSLNPKMSFHEMPAKNAALRRAHGDVAIVTNADILFGEALVNRIEAGCWRPDTLYRAHRIDVNADLQWEEMTNPANQLSSGEGLLPPSYYLGAGGDFCLATRSLWHSLRGFNEQVRFSTRAKDWQFFLSAAAEGVRVEFIGDVYHLDHEGGFRNTRQNELTADTVHFGRFWDIEFGLPASNPPDWGFHGLREHSWRNEPRIVSLDSGDYHISEEQNRRDREIMSWITAPPDAPAVSAAHLLHSICAAYRHNRRLICRIEDMRLLAALSGFDAVASQFGFNIFCNWSWPSISGHCIRPFIPEPCPVDPGDWIFGERNGISSLYEHGSASELEILPTVIPVNEPEFNPVLARRLLRAYLLLQQHDARRIAIYGAGSHTKDLLRWGVPDIINVSAFLESRTFNCFASSSAEQRDDFDAVVLSSASFESDMLENCQRQGIHRVIALYADWPRDVWKKPA
jgi:hypothetical protein